MVTTQRSRSSWPADPPIGDWSAPATPASSASPAVAEPVTRDASFARRFSAWASTRFPAPLVLLVVVMYLAAVLVGSFAAGDDPVHLVPLELLGVVAFVSFFLGMRIYDEHKDFETDRVLYPDRLTVSGVMPLGDLRKVLTVGFVVQAGTSVAFDRGVGAVTITWCIAVLWSLLMLKEFFVPEWLRAHPVIYAVSHAVAMPLVMLWAMAMGGGGLHSSAVVWWLCGLAVSSAFALELSRKIKAPEDERRQIESYSKLFGVNLVAVLGYTILAAVTLSVAVLTYLAVGTAVVPWAITIVLLVLDGSAYVRFAFEPSPRRAAKLEVVAALHVLASFLVVITVFLVSRGVPWR